MDERDLKMYHFIKKVEKRADSYDKSGHFGRAEGMREAIRMLEKAFRDGEDV